MTARVRITSGPKGSNPGGECTVYADDIKPLRGYFKYCHTSRVPKNSHLLVRNQPFYEAITLQFARQIGLKTTDYYVLLNPQKDVFFEEWRENKLNDDPAGRECYFVSKLVSRGPADTLEDTAEISKVLNSEMPYLEGLLIDDIRNKRQNYLFYWADGKGQLKYIDLGCSFVRAVEGKISLPASLEYLSPREERRMAKSLRGANIISATNSDFVDLGTVVESVFEMRIPTLNPAGSIPIKACLSEAELKEVYGYVLQGLADSVGRFEEKGLLIKE